MPTENDLYEHARRLANNYGECMGMPNGDCKDCFVPRMCADYDDCTTETALECAREYISNHGPDGNFDNIWKEVNND